MKARLLLGLNILKLEKIIINPNHKTITIQFYNNLIILIQIHSRDSEYIFPLFKIIVPIYTKVKIQINGHKRKEFLLSKNRDFLFKPNTK